MFRIYDGRECFYQWDYNQKLIVEDDTITEVHFCNKTDDCALVCAVTDNLVNVPNILLQDNWTIRVYGYAADHTKHEKHFKVCSRSKPADYVYTETEVKTFETLETRMDELESSVTAEAIEKAVTDYLEENPVEAGATKEQAKQIADNTNDIRELESKANSYALKSEIPSLEGLASESYVDNLISQGFQTLEEDYALKTEIPTKTSQLVNNSGFITDADTTEVINTALAQAKASGEFDGEPGATGPAGKDGEDGTNGKDGVSVTHKWSGTTLSVTSASGTSSANLIGPQGNPGKDGYTPVKGKDYFDGNPGKDGTNGTDGKDGVSCTHSWNGTKLTVTSASGTTTADLKGEKGDKGETGGKGETGATGPEGAAGQRGTGILKVTSAPSSYTTTTNGINPIKRMAISTIKTQAGVTEVLAGDLLSYSYYQYHIYYLDSSYAYMDSYVSVRGTAGEDGTNGTDGKDGVSCTHSWSGTTLSVTSASGTSSANLKGDKGDTGPAYTLTTADKTTITNSVVASLKTETWTFTLENGSTVSKAVLLK